MPIEIKELHIKAVVGGNNEPAEGNISQQDIAKLKKEIMRELTEKILRKLHQKNER
jgi:hypothetical protein